MAWKGKNIQRSIDDSFYRRPAWKRVRAAYIKHRESIDGGLCEHCGEQTGKIVHHKEHLTDRTIDDPDICYGFDNLELVCLDCHNREHYGPRGLPGAVNYIFDKDGNPVPTGAARPAPR